MLSRGYMYTIYITYSFDFLVPCLPVVGLWPWTAVASGGACQASFPDYLSLLGALFRCGRSMLEIHLMREIGVSLLATESMLVALGAQLGVEGRENMNVEIKRCSTQTHVVVDGVGFNAPHTADDAPWFR